MVKFIVIEDKFTDTPGDSQWHVVNTTHDVIMDSYHTKEEAEAEAKTLNKCKHNILDGPEFESKEIHIWCRTCGQEAFIPIPSNLEWS